MKLLKKRKTVQLVFALILTLALSTVFEKKAQADSGSCVYTQRSENVWCVTCFAYYAAAGVYVVTANVCYPGQTL